MDISYNELRNKEIINLCDGSRLGHVIDLVFCSETGKILGIVAPGEKRIFRKSCIKVGSRISCFSGM